MSGRWHVMSGCPCLVFIVVCVALTGQHATAQHIAHALDVHGGTKAQGPGGTRSLLQVISQLPPSPSVHDVANPPSPLGETLPPPNEQLLSPPPSPPLPPAPPRGSMAPPPLPQCPQVPIAQSLIRLSISQPGAQAAALGSRSSSKVMSNTARVIMEAPQGSFISSCAAAGPIRAVLASAVGRPASSVTIQCTPTTQANTRHRALLQQAPSACSPTAPAALLLAADFEVGLDTDVHAMAVFALDTTARMMESYTQEGQCPVRVVPGGTFSNLIVTYTVALTTNSTGPVDSALQALQLAPALLSFESLDGNPSSTPVGPQIEWVHTEDKCDMATRWWILIIFVVLLVGVVLGACITILLHACQRRHEKHKTASSVSSKSRQPSDSSPPTSTSHTLIPTSSRSSPGMNVLYSAASAAVSGPHSSPSPLSRPPAVSGGGLRLPLSVSRRTSGAAAAGSGLQPAHIAQPRPGRLGLQSGASSGLPDGQVMATFNPVYNSQPPPTAAEEALEAKTWDPEERGTDAPQDIGVPPSSMGQGTGAPPSSMGKDADTSPSSTGQGTDAPPRSTQQDADMPPSNTPPPPAPPTAPTGALLPAPPSPPTYSVRNEGVDVQGPAMNARVSELVSQGWASEGGSEVLALGDAGPGAPPVHALAQVAHLHEDAHGGAQVDAGAGADRQASPPQF